ncbi:MAG: polynucleotide adenylyltransferase [Pelosinus sp.]|nr:polynucleotide adenylyltransferase [Pelosinus sp.]
MSRLTEKEFAEIVAQNGGRAYRVGGCVRDKFMGAVPKDIDFCIVGMVKKNFKLLFLEAQECGKSFPVFLLTIDGSKREVAFARTEEKVGSGYKGFRVSAKPKITIEQDLFRRDTTINSMAEDSLTGEIIDPFQGRQDISDKVLRATSQHFSDDPMRALRLAGHAARFGFSIDAATLQLAMAAREELAEEPVERMVLELGKVLREATEPSKFFKVLAETGLLPATFKELAALPPEEFIRGMLKLDLVASVTQAAKLRFAAVGIVLGEKDLCLWHNRMTLPGDWLAAAVTVSQTIALLEHPTAERIVETINKLRRGALTIEEFDLLTVAAGLKVPLLVPLKAAMVLPAGEVVPKQLVGKEIGEWLRKKHVEAVERKLFSSIGILDN